ncbi:hypothetical protein EBZ37_03760, partial [bacterium]|nr:hypothetical protein [bacterium]
MASVQTEASKLMESASFREAAARLVQVASEASARIDSVRPAASSELSEKLKKNLGQFQRDRGRDL